MRWCLCLLVLTACGRTPTESRSTCSTWGATRPDTVWVTYYRPDSTVLSRSFLVNWKCP